MILAKKKLDFAILAENMIFRFGEKYDSIVLAGKVIYDFDIKYKFIILRFLHEINFL